MKTWTLINYFDVIGNKEEGYEINNQCVEFNDLVIADDATPKDICEYLVKIKMLATSDMRRLSVEDCGDLIEIYERKSGLPLFGLMMNY